MNLPRLNLGVVMAGPAFSAAGFLDKPPPGADRLMRTALTEAAYLLWLLRCERVIGRGGSPDAEHTSNEVAARWHATMARRRALDFGMTNRRYERKALSSETVRDTWQSPNEIRADGVRCNGSGSVLTGVLVGRLVPEYGDTPWGAPLR